MMGSADAGRPRVPEGVALVGVSATASADSREGQRVDTGAAARMAARGHARRDHVYDGAAGEGAQGG